MKAHFISMLLAGIIAPQVVTCSLQEDYFKLSAEDIDGEVVKFEKFKGMVSSRYFWCIYISYLVAWIMYMI